MSSLSRRASALSLVLLLNVGAWGASCGPPPAARMAARKRVSDLLAAAETTNESASRALIDAKRAFAEHQAGRSPHANAVAALEKSEEALAAAKAALAEAGAARVAADQLSGEK